MSLGHMVLTRQRPGRLGSATASVVQYKPSARTATRSITSHDIDTTSGLFTELLASSLLRPAVITTNTPSGSRGLVATSFIPAGTKVLEIASANFLTVPKRDAVIADWKEWLQLFMSAHEQLPHVLQDFLSDVNIHHTMRLATWLLYLKKTCLSNNSSSSSSNWRSYMSVLTQPTHAVAAAAAGGASTALCAGCWSQPELQYLEPPVFKAWCSTHNHNAAKAAVAAYIHITTSPGLADLELAESSADVSWALGLVKTRANGSRDFLSLYPLYDMFNHAEPHMANLKGRTSSSSGIGYEMQAVVDIHPGTELTHTYITPISNPQLLLGWGFTLSPKACDWVMAVQQYHGCLPLLSWQLVVQAAAAILFRCQQQQQQQQQQQCSSRSSSSSSSDGSFDCAMLRVRLISAAANLPLQLPEDVAHRFTYTRAAAACRQQSKQQQQFAVFAPMVTDQQQQLTIEEFLAAHLDVCMNHQCTEQYHHQQQQQQHCRVRSQSQQQQLQMQIWTAAAVHNSCLGQLMSCSTAAADDAALLQQLQRQQEPAVPPPQQQQQQQLAEQQVAFQVLQDQVVSHVAVMQAYQNLRSLSDLDSEAAKVLLLALEDQVVAVEQQCNLTTWQDNAGLKKAVQAVQQYMQKVVPPLLQQQEEVASEILASKGWSTTDGTWQLTSSDASFFNESISSSVHMNVGAKVRTAVAARFEQKMMLQVTADLCQEVVNTLQKQ